ncbi:hypothetical protein Cmaq_0182 [Caldivirga maquilingensis IC-167]|uniref:Uncharacterized protein n=2 Tax=Caldivirga maquilingensis TaxID=76887 RepID=A8MA99_CALMQ|nr:hypothetical protein Cmaq_0182 [Caldivirga maquilingensis IC-167]
MHISTLYMVKFVMDSVIVEEFSGGVEKSKVYSMVNGKLIELSFNRMVNTGLIEFKIATITPVNEEEFSIIAPAVGSLGFYADYVKDSKMAVLIPSVTLKGIKSINDLKILLNALSELIEEMSYMTNTPISNIEIALMLSNNDWLVSGNNNEAYKVIRIGDVASVISINLSSGLTAGSANVSISVIGKIRNSECIVKGISELGLNNIENYGYMILASGSIRTLGLLTILTDKLENSVTRVINECSHL